MIERCGITELRGNPAPQSAAGHAFQECLELWNANPEHSRVLPELQQYGGGSDLHRCAALKALLNDFDTASRFASSLCREVCGTMSRHPLADLPFQSRRSGPITTLVIASAGAAQLALILREADPTRAECADFADVERREIVLSGSGRGRIAERQNGKRIELQSIDIEPGSTIAIEDDNCAIAIDEINSPLAILRLVRQKHQAAPTVRIRLSDGAVIGRADGSLSDSRKQVFAALLGAMQRQDAVPILAELSEAGHDATRWESLRQCLVLDAATGMAALARIASNEHDPLLHRAHQLRNRLLSEHPQLASLADRKAA